MRIIGLIETLSADYVSGYCYDADNPGRPVTLDLYVDDCLIGSQLSTLKRSPRLANKLPTIRCGFAFSLTDQNTRPTKHNTRVIARDDRTVLGLHSFARQEKDLYPDRIDPGLAREARAYDELVIVNHIPKTAGSSLRLALEDAYTRRHCVYHYLDVTHCDVDIWNWKFSPNQTRSYENIIRSIMDRKIRVLLGHFGQGMGGGLTEFLVAFPRAKLATFLREPFQHNYSYFLHAKRTFGISESYDQFIQQPEHRNIQSRHMGRVDIERYDFVGIVAKFSTSLTLLGKFLGKALPEKFVNASRSQRDALYNASDIVDDVTLSDFKARNARDLRLYKAANDKFNSEY